MDVPQYILKLVIMAKIHKISIKFMPHTSIIGVVRVFGMYNKSKEMQQMLIVFLFYFFVVRAWSNVRVLNE